MITCEVAAERMSNGLDDELPLRARVALSVHRLLCAKCRRYGRLLTELDSGARDFFDASAVAPAALTAEVADRIKAALREAADE